jgi:hypothetical protein
MSNSYIIGNILVLSGVFKTAAGVLIDPTTVTLNVRLPDGTTVTPAVTHDSTGMYHANYQPAIGGIFYYRFVGTGAAIAAAQQQFTIVPSTAG